MSQQHSDLTHHVGHVVARQHGGSDDPANLALACHRCNLRKCPNLTGIDPLAGDLSKLFHPRNDPWTEHFRFDGVRIDGITPMRRTTVQVLAMNDPRRVELRAQLLAFGESPAG
jgi:HNH endonuclease